MRCLIGNKDAGSQGPHFTDEGEKVGGDSYQREESEQIPGGLKPKKRGGG